MSQPALPLFFLRNNVRKQKRNMLRRLQPLTATLAIALFLAIKGQAITFVTERVCNELLIPAELNVQPFCFQGVSLARRLLNYS